MNQVEAGILENKILGPLAPIAAQFWGGWLMHDSIKGIYKATWANEESNKFYSKKLDEWYNYHNSKEEKNIKIKKAHEVTMWADIISTALIENEEMSKNIVEYEENEMNILGFKLWSWWSGLREGDNPPVKGEADRILHKYLLRPLLENLKEKYSDFMADICKEINEIECNENYTEMMVQNRYVYLIFKTIEKVFIYYENQIDEDINESN